MVRIKDDFLIETKLGYYCKYGDFFIDPKYPVKKAIISHAHGDHAVPGHNEIYCTEGTFIFMKHRFTKESEKSYRIVVFNEPYNINNVIITFIPAGHILGSAQILMEYEGVRYLYTGDYKLQKDITCEPIEIVNADVLITETTFADPEVSHPDPVSEIKKLNDTSLNIMLGCYALGKAQRLTQMINEYCPKKSVYPHNNILPIHRLYDKYGFVKLNYEVYNRKSLKDGENKIYLVPPMTFNNYFRAKNVVRVFASGWKRLQNHNDMSLYISDHIDWSDLLYYIQEVNPTEVWTVHGDGTHLEKFFGNRLIVKKLQHNN